MGSSGGSSTSFAQSPQQQAIMEMAMPTWARAFGGQYNQPTYSPQQYSGGAVGGSSGFLSPPGMVQTPEGWLDAANPIAGVVGTTFGPAYGQSSADWVSGRTGGYQGGGWSAGTGGTSGYGTGGFNNLGVPLPTQGWFSGLDSSIKQGLWEPWNEAALNMTNMMGSQGKLSARGGYSGSAQTALGDLYSKAGTQVGTQAWNMMNPNMMAAWQMPFQMAQASLGQTLPTNVVQPEEQSPFYSMLPMMAMLGMSFI